MVNVFTTEPNAQKPSAFQGPDLPSLDFITQCMHCGLCLPHCPTYELTKDEKHSPRGRIRLVKEVLQGRMEMTPGFVHSMHFCLDCRACETACPAGVKYGPIVEAARAQIERQGHGSRLGRLIRAVMLRWIFPSNFRFRMLARLIRAHQNWGGEWLVLRSPLSRLVPRRLRELAAMSPRISPDFSDNLLAEVNPAHPFNPKSAVRNPQSPRRVGLILGCVMNVSFADVNVDTAEVLRHNGCDVVVPPGQGCCASLHGHTGDRETARAMAWRNVEAFEAMNLDAIIINAAGCGSFLRHYETLFEDDPEKTKRAEAFSKKIRDINEYLVEIGFRKPGKAVGGGSVHRPDVAGSGGGAPSHNLRVTYHEACHLVHGQKVSAQPRSILRAVPGVTLVELAESTWCCGSAGIYNITQPEAATQLQERKVGHIAKTQAAVVCSANPGCTLQIEVGMKKAGVPGEVLHPVTLLRRAYDAEAGSRTST